MLKNAIIAVPQQKPLYTNACSQSI